MTVDLSFDSSLFGAAAAAKLLPCPQFCKGFPILREMELLQNRALKEKSPFTSDVDKP